MTDLKTLVEALIFVSQEPVTMERLQAVLEGVPAADIQSAIDRLVADAGAAGRGIHVIRVGGGWLFATKPDHDREVRKLLQIERKNRLSSAGLETLAAIAYRQPVTQSEVSAIRGVDSTGAPVAYCQRTLWELASTQASIPRAGWARGVCETPTYAWPWWSITGEPSIWPGIFVLQASVPLGVKPRRFSPCAATTMIPSAVKAGDEFTDPPVNPCSAA